MNLICQGKRGPTKAGAQAHYPSDKSLSHRALLLAMLEPAETVIESLNMGGAVTPLLQAMQTLGVTMSPHVPGKLRVGSLPAKTSALVPEYVNLGSSSAAARMLIGVIAGSGRNAIVDGDATLRPRPIDWVVEPLRALGANIDYLGPVGQLPVHVRASRLHDGEVELKVGSAQALSAVLFAAYAANIRVTVKQRVRARDHTQRMMRALGAVIEDTGTEVRFEPGERRPFTAYKVPLDPSAVAYPIAAWLLHEVEEPLRIRGVCLNETRTGILEQLKQSGADIAYDNLSSDSGEPIGDITVKAGAKLAPFCLNRDADFHAMIDEVPLAVALATQIEGRSEFYGLGELTFKETNRITSTASMLAAFGASIDVRGDRVSVLGKQKFSDGVTVPSFADHRLAMTAAALGAGLSMSVRVQEGNCFRTSFPGFVECMRNLGFNLGEEQYETTHC